MTGAALLAQLLGAGAAYTYLVCTAGWTVFAVFLAIHIATSVVVALVGSPS